VLDEPSIGLHQRDNARLLETLRRLRDLGNTVIVVEHDEDAIETADYVVDVGPGAGVNGGNVVAKGTPQQIKNNPKSLTGKYLTGEMYVPIPERRPPNHRRTIKVINARGNNLKNVSAEIPLGLFTCVTGVSGGGKSTLLIDTLYKAIARKLNNASEGPAPHDRIEGLEHIDKIIDIDQSPIGRTPRSIRQPIPVRSRRSANGLPACRNQRRAVMNLAAFRSTSRAAAVKPVRATA
jgi:excinuclease ABC subunit A